MKRTVAERRRYRWLALAVALTALLLISGPARATFPGSNGVLLFDRQGAGDYIGDQPHEGDLYRSDAFGGNRLRLTRTDAIETALDWQALPSR
jgi:hypothetical protein